MKSIAVAAASLAILSVPALAQGTPAAAPSSCFIELRQLMAAPPSGIGDLGSAIHALDVALRPQVLEINTLKSQIARLEQREEAPAQSTSIEAAFTPDERAPAQAPPAVDDQTAAQIRRLQTDLGAKQAQLKLDYAAQTKALVGPVQLRINQGAQTFATSNGCAALKMARTADVAGLTGAGARNVTGEFVSWYATTNKS